MFLILLKDLSRKNVLDTVESTVSHPRVSIFVFFVTRGSTEKGGSTFLKTSFEMNFSFTLVFLKAIVLRSLIIYSTTLNC